MTSPPDSTEQRYLDELLAAMRGPCEATFPAYPVADTLPELKFPSDTPSAPTPSFLSERFEKEFRTTLLIHHYFLKAPLARNSFEAAFVRAARAGGHDIQKAPEGQRFWDIEMDGQRISLKSTSAKNLRVGSLHISKLCEAAWIQDARSAAHRERNTKRLFAEYTATVDAIIQLRLFTKRAFYEMVRIPTSVLAQVADVPRVEFAPEGPSIGIPVGQDPPDFTLKLDRSDAKVTLARIDKRVCTVEGTWRLAPQTPR
ncbi:MAG: hypothetical protein F4205_07515 [Gemmatimonadetes bacterium]|nr:hypothetical protein [Gemmatimonadota bacterium]MYG35330.1 hypothetical protein [Gemmatimonadota bacterium]